jgi:hypothetical protein
MTSEIKLGTTAQGWKSEYVVLTFAILLAFVYVYGQSHLTFIAFFSNAITPLEAFAAFATATLLLRAHRGQKGGGMSRVYELYSFGMLLWLVAECIWTLYALVFLIEIPFPSLADAFWLLGYVPLMGALLLQGWRFRDALSPWKRIAITLGVSLVALPILALTIPPLFEESADAVALSVSVSYPILDTLLLSAAIPLFLLFRKGSYWRPTLFVLLGIVLQLAADLAFAQSYLSGLYYSGSPADLAFDYSYLVLALGFYRGVKPNL